MPSAHQPQKSSSKLELSPEQRLAVLKRATVWQPPPVPIERADLERDANPMPREVSCRMVVEAVGGTTPKFDCVLETGETVKVKYAGPEPKGEVAATRLLRALGFGADSVTFVERLRCYGCPRFPFFTMKVVGVTGTESLYQRTVDYSEFAELEWVSVEHRRPGVSIEASDMRGWAWFELDALTEAPRAHVDAMRLMAAFLVHWDNKAENQRVLCPDLPAGAGTRDAACAAPLAYMQDLGATFGPRKVDLDSWRRTPIWHNRAICEISMAGLPHGGSTFAPVRISEAGRRFLGDRLTRLRRSQVEGLFRGARFAEDEKALSAWADVFERKVREIADGPPCTQS